jgi:hypothetical protein
MIGSIDIAAAVSLAAWVRSSADSSGTGSPVGDLLGEAVAGHGVHAEGAEQLAEDVVGREVAVLELLPARRDLGEDELAHRVADHDLLFGPLVHGRSSTTGRAAKT